MAFISILCIFHIICQKDYRVLSTVFQTYIYIFYIPGLLLYIYDPSVGRYNEDLGRLSFESYVTGSIIVCISVLIIQLIINYFPVPDSIKHSQIKNNKIEQKEYFITPIIIFFTVIIFLNTFLIIQSGKSVLSGEECKTMVFFI